MSIPELSDSSKTSRRMKTDMDDDIVSEDLSDYSEESFEMNLRTEFLHPILPAVDSREHVTILKGQYSTSVNHYTWIGVWGMGYNNLILGTTNEFRFSTRISPNVDPDKPYTGSYSGYFLFKTDVPKRIYERDIYLEFSTNEKGYQVKGKGTNEFGSFTLMGLFDKDSKDLTCVKEYVAEPGVKKKKAKKLLTTKAKKSHVIPSNTVKKEIITHASSSLSSSSSSSDIHNCQEILQRLMDHDNASPFLKPVDPILLNLPDYFEVIKRPMDLGTIERQLKEGMIQSIQEFKELVQLVFDNTLLYNKPYDPVSIMATSLSSVFDKAFALATTGGVGAVIGAETGAGAGTSRKNHDVLIMKSTRKRQYVSMCSTVFTTMTDLIRTPQITHTDTVINQYLQSNNQNHQNQLNQLNQLKKRLCIYKPELLSTQSSPSSSQLHTLAQDLLRLKPLYLHSLFLSLSNTTEQLPTEIDLRQLTANQQRLLMMEMQKLKEEAFKEKQERAEVARRKEYAEKVIQSERSVMKEILASSSDNDDNE